MQNVHGTRQFITSESDGQIDCSAVCAKVALYVTSKNASATDVWVNAEAPRISGICADIKEMIGRSNGLWEMAKR